MFSIVLPAFRRVILLFRSVRVHGEDRARDSPKLVPFGCFGADCHPLVFHTDLNWERTCQGYTYGLFSL